MQGKENANPNHPYLFANSKFAKDSKSCEHAPTCSKHAEEIGRLFCIDCLTYKLCSRCYQDHPGHTINKYENSSIAKEQTKEVLLLEVESTLGRLKGR